MTKFFRPIVKPRIEAYHNLVLEEDGDTGRGPGNQTIVQTRKESNVLEFYGYCHYSPDLLPHRKILETGQTNNVFINIHIGMIIQQES